MSHIVECMFDGRAFIPTSEFHSRRARENFAEGEVVLMQAENARSMRSHRHYFAALHDLWNTLPERFALEPWAQSTEHFRRWLLIRAGYSETQTYHCETKAEAGRLAAALRPLAEFSIIVARGQVVLRFMAKSQSVKAMGADDFQRSKDAVLSLAEIVVSGGDLPALGAAA